MITITLTKDECRMTCYTLQMFLAIYGTPDDRATQAQKEANEWMRRLIHKYGDAEREQHDVPQDLP